MVRCLLLNRVSQIMNWVNTSLAMLWPNTYKREDFVSSADQLACTDVSRVVSNLVKNIRIKLVSCLMIMSHDMFYAQILRKTVPHIFFQKHAARLQH